MQTCHGSCITGQKREAACALVRGNEGQKTEGKKCFEKDILF